MSKFDLWRDCPYWPDHRFKKNVCLGCGLKKPQLSNLINQIHPEKSTLEYRINKTLLLRQEIYTLDYTWSWSHNFTLADVYGTYEYSGYFGKRKMKLFPSSPLKGEKKKAKSRLRKVARLIKFYEENWPRVKENLDEILVTRKLKPYIRQRVAVFLRSLMFFDDTLTKKQTEKLVAAYTYHFSKLSERQVVEEPDSLFPNITRKTLRKWVGFVRRFEQASLG
jgi:hypothetical protein